MADEGKAETVLAPGTTKRGSDPALTSASGSMAAQRPSLQEAADFDELVEVDPAYYTVVREVARGGMGRILEARDRRLGRKVAIKEVLHHDDTALARFEREARITARLQHPGIVHVHEAGRWPSGQPFYAMKLIKGKPLDVRIAAAGSLAKRLELLPAVIAVADALAFAHSEHVIHRDLKPANVLVGDFGETVVIDWGIAKDLTATAEDHVPIGPYRHADREGQTIEGAIIGTPAYMPPEQAAGERVDARADVYALGALLYQLLAGAPPYTGKTTADVIERVLSQSPVALAEREPDAPVDLVAIAEKAMAREPADRFPTAQEMVAELKRFQTGQLVTSRRYSRWELVQRWVLRYRAPVAVGAIAIAVLAVLGVAGASRIIDERNRADVEAAIAQRGTDDATLAEARTALATDPTYALALLKTLGPGGDWREARMIAADASSRGVADRLVGRPATHLSWFGDHLAAYERDDGVVRIWDVRSRTSQALPVGSELRDLALTGDSVIGVDGLGNVLRWSIATGVSERVRAVPDLDETAWLAIAPGGRFVFAGTSLGPSRVIDVQSGAARAIGEVRKYAWTPDGTRLVVIDHNTHVSWIDCATGAATPLADLDNTTRSLVTDGTHVWHVTFDGEAARRGDPAWNRIRELTTQYSQTFPLPIGATTAGPFGQIATVPLAASPWSTTLGGSVHGRKLRVDTREVFASDNAITLSDGTANTVRLQARVQVAVVATSRDGIVASADHDGGIRLWHLPVVTRHHGDGRSSSSAATLTADHRLVMARLGPRLDVRDVETGAEHQLAITDYPAGFKPSSTAESFRIIDVAGKRISEHVFGDASDILELVHSSDGHRLASLDDRQLIVAWDLDRSSGRVIGADAEHVAIDRDGSRIASSHTDKRLVVWDATTGQPTVRATNIEVTALAFGPDHMLAVATLSGALVLFDGTGTKLLSDVTNEHYRAIAFTHDGKQLVAAGDDWFLRVWRLDGTFVSRKLTGHSGTVIGLVAADDGRIASWAADTTVRVWDLATDTAITLTGHKGLVTSVEFGPDDMLVTGSIDHTARVWDLRNGYSRALEGHADEITTAAYIDPHTILVADRYRQVAEYPDTLPHDERLLRAWLAGATNVTK